MINECLEKIKKAVYGKDVRQSIYDAILQCYEDATGHPESVASVVQELRNLEAQINNIIANATTTEGNTELLDIRVDVEGNTHETAGEAVRAQASQLSSEIDQLSSEIDQLSKENAIMNTQVVAKIKEQIQENSQGIESLAESKLDKDAVITITEEMLEMYSENDVNIVGTLTAGKRVSSAVVGESLTYTSYSTYIVTGAIPVSEGIYYTNTSAGDYAAVYALDADMNYLEKCTHENNVLVYSVQKDKYITTNKITVNAGTSYIVISCIQNIKPYFLVRNEVLYKTSDYLKAKMCAGYDGTFIENVINSVEERSIPASKMEKINYSDLGFISVSEKNMLKPDMIRTGGFFYHNPYSLFSYNGARYTVPIPVEEGVSYGCTCNLLNAYIVFLDENYTMVYYFAKNSTMNPFTVPEGYNIKYIVLSAQGSFGTNPTLYQSDTAITAINYYEGLTLENPDGAFERYIKTLITDTTENTLLNKKWLCCGDSITYYSGSYESIIATKNNMDVFVLARGGWTVSDLLSGVNNKTNGINTFTDYDHDIVTIFIGTNNRDNTIGTIDDEPAADTTATFFAQYKYLIKRFVELYPHQRIGVITNYKTQESNYDKNIRDAIIQICEAYGVAYFDCFANFDTLYYLSSDDAQYHTILSDGLHPTAEGYEILARKLEAWMRTL